MLVSFQVKRTHYPAHSEQNIVVSEWWKYGEQLLVPRHCCATCISLVLLSKIYSL
jgi:hypothetical protein